MAVPLGAVLATVVPAVVVHGPQMDRRSSPIAERYATMVLDSLPRHAALFVYGAEVAFPFWYEQLVEHRRQDVVVIAAERAEILRACIVGLCIGSERCESRTPGSQCASLQKGTAIEIRCRRILIRLLFLATPLPLFSVFHGLLPRDEEQCLYSQPCDENIRAL